MEIGQRGREARMGVANIMRNKYAPYDAPIPMTM